MLSVIGDILNWAAAGVMFPLMFLPLAALLFDPRGRRFGGSFPFFLIALVAALDIAAFIKFVPALRRPGAFDHGLQFAAWLLGVTLVVAGLGGPRRATQRLAPLFETITRGAGRVVMWLVLAMALVQFAVVILRYVFGVNFISMQESITYMHGAVFLVAAGYALLTNDHVRVDIFYRGASPRKKALTDFVGTYLLLFPVCLLIVWTASGYVGSSWSVGEGSTEQSGVQAVFLLKSMIPAFAVLMAMAGFVIAARAGETLRGRA